MSKRIERIFGNNLFDNLDKIKDNQIILFLSNNAVLKGKFSKIVDDSVEIILNSKKSNWLKINSIKEIQIDKISPW